MKQFQTTQKSIEFYSPSLKKIKSLKNEREFK